MTRDVRRNPWGGQFLLRSAVFLVVLVALGILFQDTLIRGFWTNPWLNGTILALFAFGVLYTLKGMVDAYREGRIIGRAALTAAAVRQGEQKIPQANEVLFAQPGVGEFLTTVHRVVQHGGGSGTLPYLLDSVAARGEDRRALARYLIGALVLLGLIGT
ncbi:MAG: hypothetical protein R3310_02790, partial [Candidatus Competibacteraceae bacterium]|nr:hypothetical protein [Candidatus Competibacteraceae bacterium]